MNETEICDIDDFFDFNWTDVVDLSADDPIATNSTGCF